MRGETHHVCRHQLTAREFQARPPVSFSGRGRWRRLAEDLRACPGMWTLADEFDAEHKASSLVQHLRRTCGLTASVRRVSETTWQVWACWPEQAA